MITIIPDIHADPKRLEASMSMAAGSRPAFLGDFIDAGKDTSFQPNDRAVLERARQLVDSGEALAVMGNHELNAILFHRRGSDGEPLRTHSAKNCTQHASFIDAFGIGTPEAIAWTDWFLSALPLWHDGDGFRLIHACWSDPEIALIRKRCPDGRLKPEDLPEIAAKKSDFARAVELITSGREAKLPEGYSFTDKSGNERDEVRLSWWCKNNTWRKAALSVPNTCQLPEGDLPADIAVPLYPNDAPPVFVGHYKMSGAPRIEAERALCLDYPATPCVYRWQGEAKLKDENLHVIPRHRIALAGSSLTSTGWGIPRKPLPSTGGGGFFCRIVFRTSKDDVQAVVDAMKLTPEFRMDDTSGAYFTWHPMATKRGDDETIVWQLSHELPEDIHRLILWDESDYCPPRKQ